MGLILGAVLLSFLTQAILGDNNLKKENEELKERIEKIEQKEKSE